MIRYVLAAIGLKAFSINRPAKALYRTIGNKLNAKAVAARAPIPDKYRTRAQSLLANARRIGGIAKDARVLEIGAGWVAWDTLFLRLFYDFEPTLFDVWDNRKIAVLNHYYRTIEDDPFFRVFFATNPPDRALLEAYRCAETFEDVYAAIGARLLIDDTGSLDRLASESYDLVISSDVLEHIVNRDVTPLVAAIYRVLKPGGKSSHQIVTWDHLAIYDPEVHGKNYLRYSDFAWKWLFENDVQYINRIQFSEWRDIFSGAGFIEIESWVAAKEDPPPFRIADRFRALSDDDVTSTVVHLLHEKDSRRPVAL